MGVIKRTWRRKAVTPAKRAARTQARRVSVKCETCGKRYANPLTHVCAPKSDFGKRRRKEAADRRKAAAAARRAKAKAKRSAAPRRPSARPAHDYSLCRDPDCTRTACKAYAEGVAACPLEHA